MVEEKTMCAPMQSRAVRMAAIALAAVCAMFLAFSLTACNKTEQKADGGAAAPAKADAKPVVTVTTSFLEDMVENLAGDKVQIQVIIPAGEDPHTYNAKPSDNEKIEKADLVLYHGLHFEGHMVPILEAHGHAVTAKFDQGRLLKMEEDGETITDPHFWFDIDLYKIAVAEASQQLQTLLPQDADAIKKNEADYVAKLDQLKKDNTAALQAIPRESRVVVTPHDAFSYFARLYDLDVVAPQGVSTDTDVQNSDINETVNVIVDRKIKAVFAESTTDPARMKKLQELVKEKGWDVKVVSGEGNELFSDSLAPKGQPNDNFIDMYKHDVKLMVDNLK